MLKKSFYAMAALISIFVLALSACAPQATPAPIPTAYAADTFATSEQKVLTVLHPEAPAMLNPHLSRNIKDLEPARVVYEPLATFNKDGQLVPILAEEIPSLENGDLSEDGKSVTWKLRRDVSWSDGAPFTADDVVFTYSYIIDEQVNAASASDYKQIESVEALNDFTVKIVFKDVTPAWAVPFVGWGVILPRHVFSSYKDTDPKNAPVAGMVGTGPYRVTEDGIKPQEVLLLGSEIVQTTKIVFVPNEHYRMPDKIYFDRIVWRGGGTAEEAARQALQEGNVDLAYNSDSVRPADLDKLQENSDQGELLPIFGAAVIRILVNRTSPKIPSASGELSSVEVPHPLFKEKAVRQALAHAINRDAIAELYGANGLPTYVNLVAPPQYRSASSDFYQYDLKLANQILDEAGYLDTNGDGFRENNGVNIKLDFQIEVDEVLREAQKIIQADLKAIGFDVDLKMVDPGVMYDSGVSNPNADTRFNADIMMFRYRSSNPDPSGYMESWTCLSIPQEENDWTGLNDERWCNPEYDNLLDQAKMELDPGKREQLFIKLNDMLVEDVVMIPVVWSAVALSVNKNLSGLDPTPWDSVTWNIEDWQMP